MIKYHIPLNNNIKNILHVPFVLNETGNLLFFAFNYDEPTSRNLLSHFSTEYRFFFSFLDFFEEFCILLLLWNNFSFSFRRFECNMNLFRFCTEFFSEETSNEICDDFKITHIKLFNFSSLYFCFANQPKHLSLYFFLFID